MRHRYRSMALLPALLALLTFDDRAGNEEPETEEERRRRVSRSPAGGMIGLGEHPPEEDCRGLCGAKACMDKALAELKRRGGA